MRLPVPGPRDILSVLERGAGSVEQLLAAVPRLMVLIGDAEKLLVRANPLIDDIDATRRAADAVVERTDQVVNRATTLVSDLEPLSVRLRRLLDSLEPVAHHAAADAWSGSPRPPTRTRSTRWFS